MSLLVQNSNSMIQKHNKLGIVVIKESVMINL